jgi:signal peptidase II
MEQRLRNSGIFVITAAVVIGLDQVTKLILSGSLDKGDEWPADWPIKLVHVTNSGAAFGMLEGETLFLTVTSLLAIGAIAFYYFYPPAEHGLIRVALGLLLGGALGNLIDRVREGEVVDFVKVSSFPAFNIADSSITIGVALLCLIALLVEGPAQQRDRPPAES